MLIEHFLLLVVVALWITSGWMRATYEAHKVYQNPEVRKKKDL